jgi:formylmethanofuran dehydrogenase subunit E
MADPAPVELCPRCAIRDIEDEASGWCRKCAEAAALERYRDRNDQEIARLRKNWRHRTKRAFSDAPEALAERQSWHRLLANTKPRQPVDSYVNPLQIAFYALQDLSHVKAAIQSNSRARDHVERAEEAIKQLAWAGEDGIPVKESSGRKPRKRRAASRTVACQVCGDKFMAIREAKYCSAACNTAAYRERKRAVSPFSLDP